MFPKLPRKAPNVDTILLAFLAGLIASGAVLGTVLLTRAPGSRSRPESEIVRMVRLDWNGSITRREGNAPLRDDPTVTKNGQTLTHAWADAVRRIWDNATGTNKTFIMATA